MAERAMATNAKKAMLMEAALESVNMLSAPSRMRFVIGMAADSAEINKYAISWGNRKRSISFSSVSDHQSERIYTS